MDIHSLPSLSHQELLSLYDAILTALRERGILRSTNNPVADYSEWLASRALGLVLEAKSTTGFDCICSAGLKYEVKGRRRTSHNNSVQLSAIRGLDKNHFDYLIGIVYRPDFTVEYAGKVPHSVVMEKAVYRAHTNAWILQFKRTLLEDTRVVDITEEINAAAFVKSSKALKG